MRSRHLLFCGSYLLYPTQHVPFQEEAPDVSLVVLGPDHEHIGDRGVGDPVLRPREHPAVIGLLPGPRLHTARIASVVRFSQSEATYRYHVITVEGAIVDGSNEGAIVEEPECNVRRCLCHTV